MSLMSKLKMIAAVASAMFPTDAELAKSSPRYIKKSDEEHNRINAIKKGLKVFYYGETSVYALNQRNADKKARKLNLI